MPRFAAAAGYFGYDARFIEPKLAKTKAGGIDTP